MKPDVEQVERFKNCDGDCYLCPPDRCRRDPSPDPAQSPDPLPSDERTWTINLCRECGSHIERGSCCGEGLHRFTVVSLSRLREVEQERDELERDRDEHVDRADEAERRAALAERERDEAREERDDARTLVEDAWFALTGSEGEEEYLAHAAQRTHKRAVEAEQSAVAAEARYSALREAVEGLRDKAQGKLRVLYSDGLAEFADRLAALLSDHPDQEAKR